MRVRLRDGREVDVPDYADLDLMLEHLASGRPLGEVAGEAVLFWAEVVPDPAYGDLQRQLIEECRAIVEAPR